ncbi:hypothetical protein [Oceanospirillum sanctuarii]|uniref:hypothetical protein n=1 Tax=Oceanospirillum sanctuarii TaxID=1434821 RepID=UPI000A3CFF85|nr:hypothetical protein [Oceanospirillum sanctuarii]
MNSPVDTYMDLFQSALKSESFEELEQLADELDKETKSLCESGNADNVMLSQMLDGLKQLYLRLNQVRDERRDKMRGVFRAQAGIRAYKGGV